MTVTSNGRPAIGSLRVAAGPLVPAAPNRPKSLPGTPPPCPMTSSTPDPAIHCEPEMPADTP